MTEQEQSENEKLVDRAISLAQGQQLLKSVAPVLEKQRNPLGVRHDVVMERFYTRLEKQGYFQ